MAARTTTSPGQRRFGYLVSVAVNAVMLWGAHRILDWGWFGFLTDAWTRVLPVLTASLVVAIVANVLFVAYDGVWLKSPATIAVAALGIAVSVVVWRVFPFDLAGYAFGWQAIVRVLLVLSIVGGAVAIVVEVGRLARAGAGPARVADGRLPEPPAG